VNFCLLFFGPPGVGKGTIAQRVGLKRGIPHISSGQILRHKIESGELSKFRETIAKGNLVDDEIVAKVIEKRLNEKDCMNGFILDGFPRTVPQVSMLDDILKKLDMKIDAVCELAAPENALVERVSGRMQCSECGRIYHLKTIIPKVLGKCDFCAGKIVHREDDKPETVRERLKIYRKSSEPLIEIYKKRGLLEKIDCSGSIEENINVLEKTLEKIELRKNSSCNC